MNRQLGASWNEWAASMRLWRDTPSLYSRRLTRAWNRWLETVVDGLTQRAAGKRLVARSVAHWRRQQLGLGWRGWRDAYAEYVRHCQRGFRAMGFSRRQRKEAAVRGPLSPNPHPNPNSNPSPSPSAKSSPDSSRYTLTLPLTRCAAGRRLRAASAA